MNPALLTGLLSLSLIAAHVVARRSQRRTPGSPARLVLATAFSTASAWLMPHDPLSAALNAAGALWCWNAALGQPGKQLGGAASVQDRQSQKAPLSQPAFPIIQHSFSEPQKPQVIIRERYQPTALRPIPEAPAPLPNDRMMGLIVSQASSDHQRLRKASSAGPSNHAADTPDINAAPPAAPKPRARRQKESKRNQNAEQ